jgi:hypothetical protein
MVVGHAIAGELDPSDDDGFEQVLGTWARAVPFRI